MIAGLKVILRTPPERGSLAILPLTLSVRYDHCPTKYRWPIAEVQVVIYGEWMSVYNSCAPSKHEGPKGLIS